MKKLLYTIAFTAWAISSTGQTDSLKCNPNPFVANANISFYIAAMDTFTISIYSSWGALVYQPFTDSIINTGSFSFVWPAISYPDGIYAVALTSKSGVFVHIRISKYMYASVAQYTNSTAIKVFPNPSNGLFTVEYFLNTDADINISLYDITGKTLLNKTTSKQPGLQQDIMDKELPQGIYFLALQINGSLFSTKILIQ